MNPPPVHRPRVGEFTPHAHRVVTCLRDPAGHTLVREGRESAGMLRKGNDLFAIRVRTVGGFEVEIELTYDALADHRDRVNALLGD